VYRHIRLEPGTSGAGERRIANYRSTDDPGAVTDPSQTTVNWRDDPLGEPESEIVGIEYACAGVRADLVLTNTASWFFEGTGAIDGQIVERLVGIEFDELPPIQVRDPSIEVIAATPLFCKGADRVHVTAYHTLASGSGVFATGTIDWGCGLDGTCENIPRSHVIRGVTGNVLRVFAAGPAALTHPSIPNV
jgi:hypothetical protein